MKQNIWTTYNDNQLKELHEINEKYKSCLDSGKTERECVELSVSMAKQAGYRDLQDVISAGESLKAGDKI